MEATTGPTAAAAAVGSSAVTAVATEPVRGRSPRALVIALVGSVAAGTIVFGSLQGLALRARKAESEFVEFEATLNRLDALEWQIAAARSTNDELDEEIARTRADARQRLDRLERGRSAREETAALSDRFRRYVTAVNQEIELLRAGDAEAAREWDESDVDPAFDDVTTASRAGREACVRAADSNSALAIGGALLTLMVQLLAVAYLSRRILREAHRTATAEERGRLLQESQARLAAANRRLEEANVRLEEASRLKSEFLANTSHELRTPLNGMMGFLQLVLDGACTSPAEEREFIEQALGCSRHLLALINDVLDIARIEAGRASLRTERVSVRQMFEEVATITSPPAREKGLELSFHMDSDVPLEVRADALKFKQVLVNLVGNSVKFTTSGFVRVRASAPTERGHVRIDVEDSGIGIAPDKLELIFEKFVQLDASATRKHGGTGLGLAISRGLVHNMGGLITARSEGAGRGATLTVALPRWSEPDLTEAAIEPADGQISGPERGPLALLVEDDPRFRAFVRRVLHDEGFRTVEANTAEQGRVVARRVNPDIAILDFALPVGDGATIQNGWELWQRLESESDARPIPAVFLTGYEEELRKVIEAHTSAHGVERLAKPVRPEVLLECARRLVRSNPGGRTRVLLVDDDPAIATLVVRTLPSDQFVVETITDGAECVQLLRRNPNRFDLLLLDLMMPNTSGYDVLREVRKLGLGDSLRTVVLTNAPHPHSDEESSLLHGEGVVEIVSKSEVAGDLDRLTRILSRHAAARRRETTEVEPERRAA